MIKILSLFTLLLFIAMLAGCSSLEIDDPIIDDSMTEDEVLKDSHTLTNEEVSKRSEQSVRLNQSQPKLTTQDQAPHNKTVNEQSNKDSTLSADDPFKEQYYIETPIKDPTLGNQSSEHENEYNPKPLDQNTTKEDKHSDTTTTQPQTAKPQASKAQAASATSKQNESQQIKSDQNESNKKNQQPEHQTNTPQADTSNNRKNKPPLNKNQKSDTGSKTAKKQNTQEQTKKGVGTGTERGHQKENNPTIGNNQKEIKSDISAENKIKNNMNSSVVDKIDNEHSAMSTNHNDHNADGHGNHDHDGHDHGPHSELEQDHTHEQIYEHAHELEPKTKRHWNMQRMIKTNKTNP
jgi:hypothetical protein